MTPAIQSGSLVFLIHPAEKLENAANIRCQISQEGYQERVDEIQPPLEIQLRITGIPDAIVAIP